MGSSHSGHVDLEWIELGHHLCHFFHTVDEISEVLVPYFKIGLERHESCLWIATDRSCVDRANDEMRSALADYDRRAASGQMVVVSQEEWCSRYGALSASELVHNWLVRKDAALAAGLAGLRISGHLESMHKANPDAFLAYERLANKTLTREPIVTLCGYCLKNWSGQGVLDATESHAVGLARRRGGWRPFEAWHPSHLTWSTRDRSPLRSGRGLAFGGETELVDLLDEQLAGYRLADPARIALEGGRVMLAPGQAAKLHLAFRELAANAVAFGALAVPEGRLGVRWHITANGSRHLHLTWQEHGTPALAIPEIIGQGTRLMVATVESFTRVFEPGGMRCSFQIRL